MKKRLKLDVLMESSTETLCKRINFYRVGEQDPFLSFRPHEFEIVLETMAACQEQEQAEPKPEQSKPKTKFPSMTTHVDGIGFLWRIIENDPNHKVVTCPKDKARQCNIHCFAAVFNIETGFFGCSLLPIIVAEVLESMPPKE